MVPASAVSGASESAGGCVSRYSRGSRWQRGSRSDMAEAERDGRDWLAALQPARLNQARFVGHHHEVDPVTGAKLRHYPRYVGLGGQRAQK